MVKTVTDGSGVSAFGSSPFGNEKCCSLAFCHPAAPKARIGRGATWVERRHGIPVSTSGVTLLGRDRAAASLVIRIRGMPSQTLHEVRLAEMGSSAGSTRLMKYGTRCSRVIAMTEANERQLPPQEGLARPLSSRQCEGRRAATVRAFTGDALKISFVQGEGSSPGSCG